MKKLDEIMELMTDEMADFKLAILKLQELSGEIEQMSIPISTEALDKNLNAFLEKQEENDRLKDDILKSIDQKLKNARLMPNYMLFLFCIFGILMLSLLGYFKSSATKAGDEKFEMYQMIKSESELFKNYLSENPEIKNEYYQWLEANK
ncbi:MULTISPECIES: DUF6730 family protein [Flavobacteriaceae]|uniref:Uncharacterized protein n=1 Tax=Christiangramia sediminis TaxID=2881336 RepID=A0A9X1RWN5_9FLAO|nr:MULTISPECIES: DUF6730 family protein [Flavobacteriaceae]MCB7481788.1 hypothetical protein [Christiangramia sediminis]WPY98844.1 DUF6730 family protein [Christiangramia sp. OXR-203]